MPWGWLPSKALVIASDGSSASQRCGAVVSSRTTISVTLSAPPPITSIATPPPTAASGTLAATCGWPPTAILISPPASCWSSMRSGWPGVAGALPLPRTVAACEPAWLSSQPPLPSKRMAVWLAAAVHHGRIVPPVHSEGMGCAIPAAPGPIGAR